MKCLCTLVGFVFSFLLWRILNIHKIGQGHLPQHPAPKAMKPWPNFPCPDTYPFPTPYYFEAKPRYIVSSVSILVFVNIYLCKYLSKR